MAATAAVERFTETVPHLRQISAERRNTLAENPEGKASAELNRLAPEMAEIELDNALSDAAPEGDLRVAAWNMERGRHWREAVTLLREHPVLRDVDVLLLSEMDLGMARSRNEHPVRETALALGMNYAYAVEFLELSAGDAEERKRNSQENAYGYHGNAILSRFPLSDVRMLRFPGIEKWYGSDQHRLGGRNALFAVIDVHGSPVTLVSTHLESSFMDDEIRRSEGRLILEELKRYAPNTPVILGGDFNSYHKRPVIDEFRRAGFLVDECNDLAVPTSQRVKDDNVMLTGAHIDYVAVRGLEVLKSAGSPAVIPAVYPPRDDGTMLGDHAIVTVGVRLPQAAVGISAESPGG